MDVSEYKVCSAYYLLWIILEWQRQAFGRTICDWPLIHLLIRDIRYFGITSLKNYECTKKNGLELLKSTVWCHEVFQIHMHKWHRSPGTEHKDMWKGLISDRKVQKVYIEMFFSKNLVCYIVFWEIRWTLIIIN